MNEELEKYNSSLKKAEEGDAASQFYVGYCFLMGKVVARHKDAAKAWFEKAAAQKNKEAITILKTQYKMTELDIAKLQKDVDLKNNKQAEIDERTKMLQQKILMAKEMVRKEKEAQNTSKPTEESATAVSSLKTEPPASQGASGGKDFRSLAEQVLARLKLKQTAALGAETEKKPDPIDVAEQEANASESENEEPKAESQANPILQADAGQTQNEQAIQTDVGQIQNEQAIQADVKANAGEGLQAVQNGTANKERIKDDIGGAKKEPELSPEELSARFASVFQNDITKIDPSTQTPDFSELFGLRAQNESTDQTQTFETPNAQDTEQSANKASETPLPTQEPTANAEQSPTNELDDELAKLFADINPIENTAEQTATDAVETEQAKTQTAETPNAQDTEQSANKASETPLPTQEPTANAEQSPTNELDDELAKLFADINPIENTAEQTTTSAVETEQAKTQTTEVPNAQDIEQSAIAPSVQDAEQSANKASETPLPTQEPIASAEQTLGNDVLNGVDLAVEQGLRQEVENATVDNNEQKTEQSAVIQNQTQEDMEAFDLEAELAMMLGGIEVNLLEPEPTEKAKQEVNNNEQNIEPSEKEQKTEDAQSADTESKPEKTEDAQSADTESKSEKAEDAQSADTESKSEKAEDTQSADTESKSEKAEDAQSADTESKPEKTEDAQSADTESKSEKAEDTQSADTENKAEKTEDTQSAETENKSEKAEDTQSADMESKASEGNKTADLEATQDKSGEKDLEKANEDKQAEQSDKEAVKNDKKEQSEQAPRAEAVASGSKINPSLIQDLTSSILQELKNLNRDKKPNEMLEKDLSRDLTPREERFFSEGSLMLRNVFSKLGNDAENVNRLLEDCSDLSQIRNQAKKGRPEAQYILGESYLHGWNSDYDFEEAVKYYRLAAEAGMSSAARKMGECYIEGKGVPQDYYKALAWFQSAVRGGSFNALYNIAMCFRNGWGTPKDKRRELAFLKDAAEKGDADAQYEMAVYCHSGASGIIDTAGTEMWLAKAVEQKLPRAMVMYAGFLEKGINCEVDRQSAFDILYEVYSMDCEDANALLAKYFYNGEFIEPDLLKAIQLALPSAKDGNEENQLLLSQCYAECAPPNQSMEQSFSWLKSASANGNPEILIKLAMYYIYGRGTPKNPENAVQCLSLAIKKGANDARLILADWYRKGTGGIPKNKKRAKELIKEYKRFIADKR